MRFLYLRDPLFLLCVATYFVNRWVLKSIWKEGFVHEHLNDLICIPFWVPIMLFAQRRLGLRDHDNSPRPGEVVIPLIVWSWVFEILLPETALMGDLCVADHLDILYYALGALLAALFWRWWYGRPEIGPHRAESRLDRNRQSGRTGKSSGAEPEDSTPDRTRTLLRSPNRSGRPKTTWAR